MTAQLEMCPKTTLDVLAKLEVVHRADLEKAQKALAALSDDEKIARAYEKAEDRVDVAVRLLRDIETAVERERKRVLEMPIAAEVAELVNSGAMDTEDLTVTATVSPAVDPITGEIEAVAPATVNGTGIVLVSGDGVAPFTMAVGERTRFSALVYAYCEVIGVKDVVDAEWRIVSETGIDVDRAQTVMAADYGARFIVEHIGEEAAS